ncbi:MAG: hypothetical protein IMZ65_02290, partial [Planctomycetes bacterium]|nr:hypothetical protein [Planctomycetota bacterium]
MAVTSTISMRGIAVMNRTVVWLGLAGMLVAAAGAAWAADRPALVKKDTWLETALASRDALMRQDPAEKSRDREKAGRAFWQMLSDAFPDHVTYRECRLEERAGIWNEGWSAEDLPALAARYAKAAGRMSSKAAERAKTCRGLDDLRAVRDLFYVPHAEARLALAEETLAMVERAAARPEMSAELKALRARLADAEEGKTSGEALYAKACDLRRRIILSHPLLDFPQLLINKRSGYLPEHMCDQFLGRHSQVAPGLVVLDHWKDNPKETVLLEGKLPKGGLIHPDLSFDARRVLFSFADHESPRNGQLRGYYIYEYSFDTGRVHQVTGTDRDPMLGRNGRETVLVEDMDPCYLPDGGIAFISTRSQQFGRCHGGRYVPSYTLYRAEADGSDIRALSYNESNEWAPSVLPDGSVVYCRWDYVNRHDVKYQSLWTIRPDGTQTAHYYGNNSSAPCMISEPQTIPGTYKTVCTAAAHHGQTLGTLLVVDPFRGQEGGVPLVWLTPEIPFPESGVPEGITRARAPLPEDAGSGRAGTPWPLGEELYLCTYQHGSQYAVYLVDTLGGRELIVRDAKVSCFDPVPLRPRPMPAALPSVLAAKPAEKTGVFLVQNVYASTESIPAGTIRRLRVNQIISQPTRQAPGRSAANNELVKKVLGTVPVEEDGSVAFEVPANTPMQLQLLDSSGMAVMTMRSLVYVQPGERAACVGCHESRFSAPPAAAPAKTVVRQITPPAGPQYAGGMS